MRKGIFIFEQRETSSMEYTHYEIASIANRLRDSLGICTKGIDNIFRLLEERGYKVFRYPLGRDSILGASARYGKDKVIITNSSLILSREIFTAAHELGHHELQLTEGNKAIVDVDDDQQSDMEKDADYFAACFLMPKHLLTCYVEDYLSKTEQTQLQGIDIAKIQSEFNVSFEAAVVRLNAIDLITFEQKKDLQGEKTEKTARSFFKAVSGNEALLKPSEIKYIPTEFLKIIISNYENKLVPLKSLKKIFDAFSIPLIEKEQDETGSIQHGEERRLRRGINDEGNAGY
ncbi:MAG: ImmA/IrrE family metallo-endopeptidase [Fermentimonas sp.]|nr:ImmA/IrrE family metallo-endopeptidase [Fermentimonas sp.]